MKFERRNETCDAIQNLYTPLFDSTAVRVFGEDVRDWLRNNHIPAKGDWLCRIMVDDETPYFWAIPDTAFRANWRPSADEPGKAPESPQDAMEATETIAEAWMRIKLLADEAEALFDELAKRMGK